MNDAEFDSLLRDALIEAMRQDRAPVLKENPPMVPSFSARYCRRTRLLADPFGYVKRKSRPLWNKVLRTAACLLLAIGIAFGGIIVISLSLMITANIPNELHKPMNVCPHEKNIKAPARAKKSVFGEVIPMGWKV